MPEDIPSEKDTIDTLIAIVRVLGFLTTDLLLYGWIVPIIGVYFAVIVINHVVSLEPFYEIVLVISSVSILLFLLFYTHDVEKLWRQLLYRKEDYFLDLRIRDFFNVLMIAYYVTCVFNAIENMVRDKGMKKDYLGEGLGLISETCQEHMWAYAIKLVNTMGLGPRSEYRIRNIHCSKEFIHGTEFIFAIAGLTASIMKLLYFNTQDSYLRAMKILIEVQEELGGENLEDLNEKETYT